MQITGTVKYIGQTEQISDKFKKREAVITTEDNPTYPQHVSVQVVNDKCVMFDNLPVGSKVTAHVNIKGKEWTSPQGQTKYFNTIECWKLDVLEQGNQVVDDGSGLPF